MYELKGQENVFKSEVFGGGVIYTLRAKKLGFFYTESRTITLIIHFHLVKK